MQTADKCRELAVAYQTQARAVGVSPKMAVVLLSISRSFETLAGQYELLSSVAEEERQR